MSTPNCQLSTVIYKIANTIRNVVVYMTHIVRFATASLFIQNQLTNKTKIDVSRSSLNITRTYLDLGIFKCIMGRQSDVIYFRWKRTYT